VFSAVAVFSIGGGVPLATTWIKPIRASDGKSIAQTMTGSIKYITNPKKTEGGKLVMGYACDPRTAATEFLLARQEYTAVTGRGRRKRDVLLYHMRQSFKPGEIDPETANRLGHDWAMRFTKGKHAFIVTTHTDKEHIHNHIMFHSVSLDCTRKFRNPFWSSKIIQRISDHICLENGLSVIETPKPSRGHYGAWLGDKKAPNYRAQIEHLFKEVLAKQPSDFDAFIHLLEQEKCEFNRKRRSVRLEGRKGFVRLRTLSADYKEEAIRDRIGGMRMGDPPQTRSAPKREKLNLLIDLQNSIKAQNSPGYEHWATVFSLKQSAKTLLFLQEHGLTDLEKLHATAQGAKDDFNAMQTRIHAITKRLDDIKTLQKHIGAYRRTRDAFVGYRTAKNKRKYYLENENAIATHKTAKAYFNEHCSGKLPTIKALQQEYATLAVERKKLYSGYHAKRDFMKDVLTARENVSMMLGDRDAEQARKRDRGTR